MDGTSDFSVNVIKMNEEFSKPENEVLDDTLDNETDSNLISQLKGRNLLKPSSICNTDKEKKTNANYVPLQH